MADGKVRIFETYYNTACAICGGKCCKQQSKNFFYRLFNSKDHADIERVEFIKAHYKPLRDIPAQPGKGYPDINLGEKMICPFLSDDGCIIKRTHRPYACLQYDCGNISKFMDTNRGEYDNSVPERDI
jgi:hypothetical protein